MNHCAECGKPTAKAVCLACEMLLKGRVAVLVDMSRTPKLKRRVAELAKQTSTTVPGVVSELLQALIEQREEVI